MNNKTVYFWFAGLSGAGKSTLAEKVFDYFIKNILDIDDIYYFPYVMNLIELNFITNYLEDCSPNKIIPLPIYSLFIHAITYNILYD